MTPLKRRLCIAVAACLSAAITFELPAEEPSASSPGSPAVGVPASSGPAPAAASDLEFFEKKIRPVLATRCHQCHGPDKQKGGLRLDSHALVMAGGELGPEIVPGKPGESRLIEAVRYENPDLQMPPKGKLQEQEIADLTRWVAIGSPWPSTDVPLNAAPAVKGPASGSAGKESSSGGAKKEPFDLAARKARHWCWQPLRPAAPGPVAGGQWVRQPSDQFVLARLEQSGMKPAPPAERRTLIRRATFDLLGLPPTAGRSRSVCERRQSERLGDRAGPVARVAPLWRALGSSLDGPGTLRRNSRS